MWTGTMALVRFVIAFSTAAGSRQSESSTSTMTGIALLATTVAAVAKNVYAGTITSSPAPIPSARYAETSADVQELTARQCFDSDQIAHRLLGRLDLARARIVVAEQVRTLKLPIGLDQFRDLPLRLGRELPEIQHLQQFLATDLRGIRPQTRHGLRRVFGLLDTCHSDSPICAKQNTISCQNEAMISSSLA